MNKLALIGTLFILMAATGCIERTISINTKPEGAIVFLNDQEVGRSPVRVPFTWYGDYDIVIRKHGYKAIHTNHRLKTPWYQYPLIDVVTECFIPFTVHDDRVLDTFELEPYLPPGKQELVQRADAMRTEARDQAAQ